MQEVAAITRILIAGGRDFADYEMLSSVVSEFLSGHVGDVEIVSGHAKGADALGERYATEHGIPLVVMKAEWGKYGKAAGVIRNRQMLDYISLATPAVFAFWDGKSHGTKHTIETSRKMGIEPTVIYY